MGKVARALGRGIKLYRILKSSGKLLSFYVGVTRAPISGLKVHAGNSVESSLLGGGVERETVRRLWSSPGVLGWALAGAIGSLSDV